MHIKGKENFQSNKYQDSEIFFDPSETQRNSLKLNGTNFELTSATNDVFHDAQEKSLRSDSEVISVKCDLDEKINENLLLNAELQNLKLHVAELTAKLELAHRQQKKAEDERDHAKSYLKSLPLPQALANAEKSIEQKTDECHSLMKLMNYWKNNHSKVAAELGKYQIKLSEKNVELSNITKEKENLESKLDSSSNVAIKHVEMLTNNVELLLEQNEQLTIQNNSYENEILSDIQKYSREILDLTQKLDTSENKNQQLQCELNQCEESEKILRVAKAKVDYKVSEVIFLRRFYSFLVICNTISNDFDLDARDTKCDQ